jgi:hypothetical protein
MGVTAATASAAILRCRIGPMLQAPVTRASVAALTDSHNLTLIQLTHRKLICSCISRKQPTGSCREIKPELLHTRRLRRVVDDSSFPGADHIEFYDSTPLYVPLANVYLRVQLPAQLMRQPLALGARRW